MKRNRWILGLVALSMLGAGCHKQAPDEYSQLDDETKAERKYVNTFAWNIMNTYYLWREEISAAMDSWKLWDEPIQKIADIRYKDAAGKDIDRWTMVTDDMSSFEGSVSGHTRTLGMDFLLYYTDKTHTQICVVVTYTYAGSPAASAGLGRGDVILTVDGLTLMTDNYLDIIRNRLLGGGRTTLGLSDGKTVTLTATDMYENPVQTVRVLERPDGRKVGYLHYTSFTLDSCAELVDVFRNFKTEGIDDLVLDLRYNGGGYVITELVLASMVAPVAVVEGDNVFYREVYNAKLTQEAKDDQVKFMTEIPVDKAGTVISTAGANPDLPRLYVLVTDSSASASESLICCLRPYMDVTLIGQQTSGKYCAGYMFDAESWYDAVKKSLEEGEYEKALPYVENWGMYVMYSRYADCNGVTLSMPDGIAPDVEAKDDPTDGFALGDPQETMLAAALRLIEGRTRSAAEAPSGPGLAPVPDGFHPRTTGLLIGSL